MASFLLLAPEQAASPVLGVDGSKPAGMSEVPPDGETVDTAF